MSRKTATQRDVGTSVRALVKNVVFDRLPGTLRRGPAASKRVALTFDDGPDDLTEQYLDLLDDLGVPATFFVIGEHCAARPELVREYLRRGHQIAGHGYDHTRFTKLGRKAAARSVRAHRDAHSAGRSPAARGCARRTARSTSRASLTLIAAGYTSRCGR